MSRLFIAEKPSLAQAVAAVLPGQPQRRGVATQVGTDYLVPLAGHILEQAMPDAYLPDDVPLTRGGAKVWRQSDLPIVPKTWILQPRSETQRNLDAIRDLLEQVTEVVHLGDPDEEGQLLVDEVLLYLGNRKPVKRLLVNDYNATKVRQALAQLRDNDEPQFRGWYRWALARSHYDWLLGLNVTRAATLRARELGYDGVLTVGSVQTPALKLVVDRDRVIEQFRPVAYYTISAVLRHADGAFQAKWQASEAQTGLDEAGRLVDPTVAQRLVTALSGQPATIVNYERTEAQEPAPLPFSLNELTITACKRYGYSAQQVLDAAQALYEQYKVTSYPRTENRYLSAAQHADAPQILAALAHNLPELEGLIDRLEPARQSRAFDDAKMAGQAHHGIVPTVAIAQLTGLTPVQRHVYGLIVRSYLAQFLPPYVYQQTRIEVQCERERLVATGRTPVSAGWREACEPEEETTQGPDAEMDGNQCLPVLPVGDALACESCRCGQQSTKPPARFDDASLTAAMVDLHKYTTDPAAKARLKAGKGIGTSATRAGILQDLRERGFLVPVKGSKTRFMSSASGRALIDALPEPVKDPTMAGIFKLALDAVASGEVSYEQFIERHVGFISRVVNDLRTAPMQRPQPQTLACPTCGTGQLRRLLTTKGAFWGCSNFRADPPCKTTLPDRDGQPASGGTTHACSGRRKSFGFKKVGAP
ncbi:DNA topoisomerase 3 [Cupriavidus necator]